MNAETKREMNTRAHAAILVSTLIGMAFARRRGRAARRPLIFCEAGDEDGGGASVNDRPTATAALGRERKRNGTGGKEKNVKFLKVDA